MNARSAALQGLIDFRLKRGTVKLNGLPPQEKALATQLYNGVLQNMYKLDACIKLVSRTSKIQPQVRDILRLGVYQLLFLDKIPKSAAVDESVKLAKQIRLDARVQGFINGALRSVAKWDKAPVFDELWIEYSHPEWLVDLLNKEKGLERTVELLKFNNTAPPSYIQLLKPEYKGKLLDAGAAEHSDGCLVYRGSIESLPGYGKGAFIVADNAARLAVEIANPQKGERVLDACAAPGGKSIMLYHAANGEISLECSDKHPYKVMELKETLAKVGMNSVECNAADASEFRPEHENAFDLVLADVPCSCLGIIRKKPDVRYRERVLSDSLPRTQTEIINNLARYVAPGGRLIYVTCTILKCENQDIIRAFLNRHPDFRLEAFETRYGSAPDGEFTTPSPEKDIDGFYYAKLRRDGY